MTFSAASSRRLGLRVGRGGQPGDPWTTGTIPIAFVSSAVSVLGVILSGKIVVPTFAYTRERERADKWETESLRLNELIQSKYVPSLDLATAALTKSNEVLAVMNARRRQ